MPEPVDILLTHAHLFTMQGEGVGYVSDGAVAIRGDSIAAVGSSDVLVNNWSAKETIDAITSAKPIKDFQEGSEAFNEIEKTLGELRRDNPKIMIEFARVTERPVMRGRPPKSKSLR